MPAVVGCDLSSFAVDLVKLDENTDAATWTRAQLTGENAFDRLRSLKAVMPPASWWDDVYLVGIEQVFGFGGKSTTSLQRVYGAIVACIPARIHVWEIHPTEWRKALGLPGNAPKVMCSAVVLDLILAAPLPARTSSWHLGIQEWPADAFDAYAIAYCARESNARAISDQLEATA